MPDFALRQDLNHHSDQSELYHYQVEAWGLGETLDVWFWYNGTLSIERRRPLGALVLSQADLLALLNMSQEVVDRAQG